MKYQLKQQKIEAVQFKEGMKKPIPGTSLSVGGRTVLRTIHGKCTLRDGDYVFEDGTVMCKIEFEATYTPVKKTGKPKAAGKDAAKK